MLEHAHDWKPLAGHIARYFCGCGELGRRVLTTGEIVPCGVRGRDELEITARPTDYDDPFRELPPWWRDSNHFERPRAALGESCARSFLLPSFRSSSAAAAAAHLSRSGMPRTPRSRA